MFLEHNTGPSPHNTSSLEYSGESRPVSGLDITPSSDFLQGEGRMLDKVEVHLPNPFFPPSIVRMAEVSEISPRPLPTGLDLPQVPQEKPCNAIDPQDIGTPDAWVPRDPRLVRLTGKHPFNCEPRLKNLFSEGFLTPSNLFYVRNHGAVPKVDRNMANEWKLEIHGLCFNPVTFTLADLRTQFEVITVPITLVCAGNRRKEQNVVQKSLGFSWGAGGVSTALFTGVYLSDVLEYVKPSRRAKHVIFEGADKLPNGPYGTSQHLSWGRDKSKGMMLSWAMNGLALEPDHGFPLRLVVPSQIGGRSVKWLTRIELSDHESQHHLHFYDNKVLPMPLGPDKPRAEKDSGSGWWYDPRYIIRELNVNSVIACPDHGEIVETASRSPEEAYTMRGYAYAGGGRRVTRVELSFDDGTTWCLAHVTYPEDLFQALIHSDPIYGTLDLTQKDSCFCWCFWSFDTPFRVLKESAAVMVRCMDESMAIQPRDMYWNATGMMNNWWFRVCIHKLDGGELRFEHPTMAGTQPGGWMQRIKDEGMNPAKPTFLTDAPSNQAYGKFTTKPQVSMTNPSVDRKISVEELQVHIEDGQPWFVVCGEVYDGTSFLNQHPGGPESISLAAGEDVTEDFLAIHSVDARKQLADFHIGAFVGSPAAKTGGGDDESGPFLNTKTWKKAVLVSIKDVSKDGKVYRFALQRPDQALGLLAGQHVYARLRRITQNIGPAELTKGELVQRAYTPLSRQHDKGFVDLLIKIYYPNSQFPLGGRMTLGFASLTVGDVVELKGPIGHFIWKGSGVALLRGKERRVREIGLISGGSGITPILQVLRAILYDPSHHDTKVWVLYVNRHSEDILCRDELDQLLHEHSSRYRVHYTLTGNRVPDGWEYSTGRINDKMLRTYLPSPAEERMVCICGPSPMEQATKDALGKMGWDPSTQLVIF